MQTNDNFQAILITGMACFNWAIFSLVGLILARHMPAADYGRYGVVVALITTLATLATLGLEKLVLRGLSHYTESEKWEEARGLLRLSVIFAIISSVIVAIGSFLIHYYSDFKDLRQANAMNLLIVFLPIIVLFSYLLEVASAKGNYLGSTLIYRVVLPLLMLSGVGMLGSFDSQVNLYQALLCYGGAWLLALGPIAWQARGILPPAQRYGKRVYYPRLWLKRSLSFLSFGLLNTLLNSSGLLVLGYIHSDATETGYYAAVAQLTNIVVVLGTATNRFYLPELSRIMDRNDPAALARLFHSRHLIVLGVSAIYLLVVLSAGQPILRLFGSGYEQAWIPWLLLSAALCINIRYAIHAAYLQNEHHDLEVLLVLVTGVVFNFALLIPMTLKFGIIGAASSTSIALVAVSLGFKVLYERIRRRK